MRLSRHCSTASRAELAKTEMHFTVFYGVLDPIAGRLSYAGADPSTPSGCRGLGPPQRLEATAPPLGLAAMGSIQRRQVPWATGTDLLVLWTDGLVDAKNDARRAIRRDSGFWKRWRGPPGRDGRGGR